MKSHGRPLTATLKGMAERLPNAQGKRSEIAFEHGSLQVKLYAPRGTDPQQPHSRDELYVVARGSGTYVYEDHRISFQPNDVLFAPAGVPHRFEDFSDDFYVWVAFYGPEGGEAGT